MDLRLRRALGMLRLGKATEAAEAAAEAGQEAGQPPLAALSVAARLAAAGAKSFCEGEAEDEALEELAVLKVSPGALICRLHGILPQVSVFMYQQVSEYPVLPGKPTLTVLRGQSCRWRYCSTTTINR